MLRCDDQVGELMYVSMMQLGQAYGKIDYQHRHTPASIPVLG